jgi:hypothetical protein
MEASLPPKRLWAALLTGLIAFATTLLVVWNTLPGVMLGHSFPMGYTRDTLRRVAVELKTEKEQTGAFPKTLALSQHSRHDYQQKDSWGHPLTYEVREGKAIVGTLGRDGKPGGEGFDADFTSEAKRLPRPTIGQLLQPTGSSTVDDYLVKCLLCCLFNGFFWALALLLSKEGEVKNKALNYMGLLVIFGITVFGALVMAALDVPTGH